MRLFKDKIKSATAHSESGAVLIMILVVYTSLLSFSGVLYTMVINDADGVAIEMEKMQALYLAEAGISQAMFELKNQADKDGDGLGSVPMTSLGVGTFHVVHDAKRLTLISIGEVNGVKRELEMQYGSQ